jgi:hypothetical protein
MPVDKEKIESAKQIDLLMLFGNPYDHAPEDAVTLFENSLKDKGCKTLVVVGGIGAGTAPLIAKMKLSVDSQDQVTLTNLGIRKPIFRGNVWKELAKDAVGGGKTAIKTEVRKYISEAELYTEKILQEFIDRGYKREDFLVIFEEDAAEKKALIAAHKGIVILVENASIHAGDNANFARDLLVSVDMFEKLDVSKMVFMQYKDLYRRSCFHMQEKFGTKKEPIHYALDQRRNYSVANPLQKNEHLQFIFQEFINTYNQVKNAKLPFSKLECENVLKFLKDDKVSYLELFESEEKVVLFFEMQKFLGQFLMRLA